MSAINVKAETKSALTNGANEGKGEDQEGYSKGGNKVYSNDGYTTAPAIKALSGSSLLSSSHDNTNNGNGGSVIVVKNECNNSCRGDLINENKVGSSVSPPTSTSTTSTTATSTGNDPSTPTGGMESTGQMLSSFHMWNTPSTSPLSLSTSSTSTLAAVVASSSSSSISSREALVSRSLPSNDRLTSVGIGRSRMLPFIKRTCICIMN
jgi:hypothetical protein